jgi:hypothetical protein
LRRNIAAEISDIWPALDQDPNHAQRREGQNLCRIPRRLGTVEPSVWMDVDTKLAAEHSRRHNSKHKEELAVAGEP